MLVVAKLHEIRALKHPMLKMIGAFIMLRMQRRPIISSIWSEEARITQPNPDNAA
jgi:hypothetical protein